MVVEHLPDDDDYQNHEYHETSDDTDKVQYLLL